MVSGAKRVRTGNAQSFPSARLRLAAILNHSVAMHRMYSVSAHPQYATPRRGTLRTDRSGATALEFALVMPALVALLLASVVTSLVYFAQGGLETATEVAARQLMTGIPQKNGYTASQFKQAACNALPPFMACSKLMIDVQSAGSFTDINTSPPTIRFDRDGTVTNNFAFTPGRAGDIVILRLMYIWDVPTGPLGFDLSNLGNGRRLLVATSVAKTEPYI